MKYLKHIIFVFILVLALVLVGCGGTGSGQGGGQGGGNEAVDKTIEQIKADVQNALTSYEEADFGSFKLVTTNGDATSTIDMTYNYEANKTGIISMKTILTNAKGEISCYITDGKAYVNRYDSGKNIITMASKEGEEIAEDYTFTAFCEYVIVMLNDSYFANSKVESKDGNVYKTSLNISTYDISDEVESEVLTTIYDGIISKTSVTLEVTYSEASVTALKVTLVGDTTSTIELQLLGTAESEIEIQFPDFSNYNE